jgi:hypothetical protein
VPGNALNRDIPALGTALRALQTALAPLEAISSVATWLLGLDRLLELLPVDPHTTVAVADPNGRINLDDYELDHSVLPWNWGDWDWEDEASSIFLFGPPAGATINAGARPTGSSVAFYSAPDWTNSEGQYNIDIGFELVVEVPTLASKYPSSIPIDALTVVANTTDDNFNDVLSTLTFL